MSVFGSLRVRLRLPKACNNIFELALLSQQISVGVRTHGFVPGNCRAQGVLIAEEGPGTRK